MSTFGFIPVIKKAHAAGNTYYVKATGNDTLNGLSDGTAWATLSKVRSSLGGTIKAGDTVLFNRGDTFAGYFADDSVVSGTAGNPITFDRYGAGANPIINAAGQARAIDIRSVNYLTFQNLTIVNATGTGFLFYTGLDHIILDHITMSASPDAISVGPGTFSNITISNSSFSGTARGITGAVATTYTTWTITNSTFNGSSGGGVSFSSTAAVTDLTISDSQFNNNGGYGLSLSTATGLNISNSSFSHNGGGISANAFVDTTLSGITADSNATGDGLRIAGSGSSNINVINSTFRYNSPANKSYNGVTLTVGTGSNITFINCISAQNGGDGFNIHNDWTNVIFDHCTADNNGIDGATTDGDGFSFHENSTGTIRYSIAKNNKKSAVLHVGHAQVTHYNNLFYNATNGTQPLVSFQLPDTNASFVLYNNVIWNGGTNGSCVGLDGTSIAKNNIIVGCNYGIVKAGGATVTEDYNLVYGAATANFSGISPGAHDIQSNPLLVNPITDFHLQSTSPAIDAGYDTGITTDYDSNTRRDDFLVANTGGGTLPYYDIGAYEYLAPLAVVPAAPTLSAISTSSINIVINANGNVDTAEYAIENVTNSQWVQVDGSLGASEVWQNKVAWGGDLGVANTGLLVNTSYDYKVKARNAEHVETALSGPTSRYTLSDIPVLSSIACPSQTTYCLDTTPDITVTNALPLVTYRYLVDQTLAPDIAAVEAGTADTDGTFTVPDGQIHPHATFYIHVIAQNLDGDFSTNYTTYKIISRDSSGAGESKEIITEPIIVDLSTVTELPQTGADL